MEIFTLKTVRELRNKLATAEAEREQLRLDLQEAGAQAEQLVKANADYAADLKAKLATAGADLAAAKETAAKATETAEAELDNRVAIRAAELTAAQGVPPLYIAPTDSPVAKGTSLAEQFRSINDPKARTEFWAKHGNEILG